MMYATFGNAQTGEVGPTLGPFPFAQLTYDSLRAGDGRGDAYMLAWLDKGMWRLALEREITMPKGGAQVRLNGRRIEGDPGFPASIEGSLWTDVTLHNDPENALA